MNMTTNVLESNAASGNFARVDETLCPVALVTTAKLQPRAPAGLKSRWAKWLLLGTGVCATIPAVKAAVLVGQIFNIINALYDSSLN
jgi:hypothetical protein